MKIKIKVIIVIISIILASCSKIPTQSIDLMNNIQIEGQRMHTLNVMLTNKIFKEKRKKIDEFMKLDYTPKYIEEFIKKIPQNTDFKIELTNIMTSVIPKLNERRDAMQNTLESNRIKIIDKLNTDFQQYKTACDELKKLLESAVKVDEERKKLHSQVSQLTQNKIDFDQLDITIDKFIQDTGDWGENINNLNSSVNKLINK
ncbi:hypothetical protein EZL74_11155 [Flavobacterium silvisoli]|uniref:Uncharacterized protein n=1 Tax=Flavobacterium silvisoli TaxID=2529433 RepID=A0A4Q9YRG0_9FLAO|nr:hypothetical protein [Flavobacterium silvisoli]TBX66138.1 hypothetical protein EZL74_11155 [Flavobacterium silvisoli]